MSQRNGRQINTAVELQLARSGNSGWNLDITEQRSRIMVMRTHLTDDEVGRMLSTRPVVIDAELWSSSNHGMKLDVTSVELPITTYGNNEKWEHELDRIADELSSSHPTWSLQRETFNSYRTRVDGGVRYYKFTLKRWVDDEPVEAGQA